MGFISCSWMGVFLLRPAGEGCMQMLASHHIPGCQTCHTCCHECMLAANLAVPDGVQTGTSMRVDCVQSYLRITTSTYKATLCSCLCLFMLRNNSAVASERSTHYSVALWNTAALHGMVYAVPLTYLEPTSHILTTQFMSVCRA